MPASTASSASTCRPKRTTRSAPRSAPKASTRSASPPPPPTPPACRPVLNGASGFLYYVSVAGITGLQQATATSIDEAVRRIRAVTDLPVAVGFGIRTPDQAAAVARVADGVVVGSAIVELVGQHGNAAPAHVRTYIATLRAAIDATVKEPA